MTENWRRDRHNWFNARSNITGAQQSRLSLFSTKYNGLILFSLDKERTEHCYANSMVSAIESFFMFPLSLCEALRSMVFTLKFSFDAKKRNEKGQLVQIKIIVRRVRCPFWSSSFHVLFFISVAHENYSTHSGWGRVSFAWRSSSFVLIFLFS